MYTKQLFYGLNISKLPSDEGYWNANTLENAERTEEISIINASKNKSKVH